MKDLLIHPRSWRLLQALAQRPPHAMLLTGERGVGLGAVARGFATQMNARPHEVLPNEKGIISIETIRELYQHTRTKHQLQCIIIDDADAMTSAAQNALLKLLEEPQAATRFILTAHQPQHLLPTITSRVQHATLHAIEPAATKQLLDTLNVAAAERAQLTFMASGLPAELTRLATDKDYFARQAAIMKDAKQYLQGSNYDKIRTIHAYSQDRAKAITLLEAASRILQYTIHRQPQLQPVAQLQSIHHTLERIQHNGHVKTQLLSSVLAR